VWRRAGDCTPYHALASLLLIVFSFSADGAGVTLITHGNGGTTTNWVTGMANALAARIGGNIPIYRVDVTNGTGGYGAYLYSAAGGNPLTTPSGEIIIKLDWGTLANTSHTTYSVANVVAQTLTNVSLISQLNGHALAEFPLHIMGHSRGGSLVCELSQRLGEQGIWVDQVTTLDAYPLGDDAPAAGYENVLFAESYYETDYWLFDGEFIPNAHRRRQTEESGGYNFPYNWHSDVHLWYHGTINLGTDIGNNDSGITITASMRNSWWTAAEQKGTNAGFIYSRLGGGNRFSTLLPNGANSTAINTGLNRNFDVGAGVAANRTALMFNQGDWPNVIRLDHASTNPVSQGAQADLQIYYQWARDAGQFMNVEVWRDADQNPLNGNETLLQSGTASGTTAGAVMMGSFPVNVAATNVPVGTHRLFVKLGAGGKSRVLYAAQPLQVIASAAPPWLDVALNGTNVLVGVNGSAGQQVVLQVSPDLLLWQSAATNVLTAPRWEVSRPTVATNEFFRAVVLPKSTVGRS
jgi:pimeloyl-ACP methyl ester carboxylesterase